MCVPGPDGLVGIHVTTCVGDPGRMVTDFVYEWMALGVRMELRGTKALWTRRISLIS